jgi:hypothetical protein
LQENLNINNYYECKRLIFTKDNFILAIANLIEETKRSKNNKISAVLSEGQHAMYLGVIKKSGKYEVTWDDPAKNKIFRWEILEKDAEVGSFDLTKLNKIWEKYGSSFALTLWSKSTHKPNLLEQIFLTDENGNGRGVVTHLWNESPIDDVVKDRYFNNGLGIVNFFPLDKIQHVIEKLEKVDNKEILYRILFVFGEVNRYNFATTLADSLPDSDKGYELKVRLLNLLLKLLPEPELNPLYILFHQTYAGDNITDFLFTKSMTNEQKQNVVDIIVKIFEARKDKIITDEPDFSPASCLSFLIHLGLNSNGCSISEQLLKEFSNAPKKH